MIFTYDLTNAMQMNGDQPIYGRACRALACGTTLLRPVKFLYYAQLIGYQAGNAVEEVADDGIPIVFDDEARYHFGLAGGDPAKILLMCQQYAAVVQRIRAKAPSCPISVYGMLPDDAGLLAAMGSKLVAARKLLTDQMDFIFYDLSDASTPPAGFDTLLSNLDKLRAEFPALPVMVKICPGGKMTDTEFARRLTAAVHAPNVAQICVWPEGGADWPDLAPNYATIAKQMARDYPGGAALTSRQSLASVSDDVVAGRLTDSLNEVSRRQTAIGNNAAYWAGKVQAASAMLKK